MSRSGNGKDSSFVGKQNGEPRLFLAAKNLLRQEAKNVAVEEPTATFYFLRI